MKFLQLEIGQRFVYQGEVYTKDSPLSACRADNGSRRGMRRADPVQPETALATPGAPTSGSVGREQALNCLQGLYDAGCLALQSADLTLEQQQQVQQKMEFALQMYRQQLSVAKKPQE